VIFITKETANFTVNKTGAKAILYSSERYALRYLKNLFGLVSPQIVIQPDPASTLDMDQSVFAEF